MCSGSRDREIKISVRMYVECRRVGGVFKVGDCINFVVTENGQISIYPYAH